MPCSASEDDASATLASIAGGERSQTVRFPDSDARRELLERVVERFSSVDRERRRRTIVAQIDALLEAGQTVPPELLDEQDALYSDKRAKVKG